MKAMIKLSYLVIAVCIAGFACSPKPASIELVPKKVTLKSISDGVGISARVLTEEGEQIPEAQVAWRSSDPSIAEIDSTGTVVGKSSGDATVTASVEEVEATVDVTVAIYTTLSVEPSEIKLTVGDSAPVQAAIRNEKDDPIPDEVAWKSENDAVAKVSETGVVSGVAPGETSVTASAESLSASLKVVVLPPGPAELKAEKTEFQLKAKATEKALLEVLGADGNPMNDVPVSWTTADETVATVSPEGEILAVGPGETTVTATAGEKSLELSVVVTK